MMTTKTYDFLNRLTVIQSGAGSSPVASFTYNYNSANQRTAATNVDNSYWVYQYDSLGQVTSGKKYWADGTPVAGQQFTYNFDDIGNRKTTASGGDGTGANLRTANYTANNLNQYTSRDVPGYATVLGSANPQATVTVNLQRAVRQGSYFWDELAANNASASLYLSLTNLAVLNNGTNADIVTTNMGNVYLAQTPEAFGYDLDGNLTNDGRFSYVWDAENRLLSMTSLSGAPTASKVKLDFAYDYQSRRVQKIVSTNNGSVYVPQSTNRFVYDGWNLLAELSISNSTLRTYCWGLDLSGSLGGAGGVGGLVAEAYYGTSATNCFVAFDGNGNVAALVNAADGKLVANYEYDPFGQVIRATGPMAKTNPIRFSTKYQDDDSGMNYYGYRFYNPNAGRWLSRDPIGETGGENIYGHVENSSQNKIDLLGAKITSLELLSSGNYSDNRFSGLLGQPLNEILAASGNNSKLGFEGGKALVLWDSPQNANLLRQIIDIMASKKEGVGGMVKWRANAKWCIPADKKLPSYEQYASNIKVTETDKDGKVRVLNSITGPIFDGPSSQRANIFSNPIDPNSGNLDVGKTTTVSAWDAPRYGDLASNLSGYTVNFQGDWDLRVEDSENAMEISFRVTFTFDGSNPSAGTGKVEITKPAHEVEKKH